MPKALCLFSLVASALIALVFLVDAIGAFTGNTGIAPMGGANLMLDIVFLLVGIALAYMSFTTLREQR